MDGRVWERSEAAGSSGVWANFGLQGLTGTPTAVTVRDGVQLFATSTAGTIKTAVFHPGDTAMTWTDLGGTGVTDRVSALVAPGYLVRVVARQGDGSVITRTQTAPGSFEPTWTTVEGLTAIGAPAAVLDPVSGLVEILARDAAKSINRSHQDAQGSPTWTAWEQLPFEAAATDPVVTRLTGSTYAWMGAYRTSSGSNRVITSGAVAAALAKGMTAKGVPSSLTVHRLPDTPVGTRAGPALTRGRRWSGTEPSR